MLFWVAPFHIQYLRDGLDVGGNDPAEMTGLDNLG